MTACRADRHLELEGFGATAQARLAAAHVLVVGAGGLGLPVLAYLAASGVGALTIVDDDVVDESNLQRQVLYRPADVGHSKAVVAAQALRALNPDVAITAQVERFTSDNAAVLLAAGVDVIVDACDNFRTRYAMSDAATAAGLPVVWGTVRGWDGYVSVWWSAAPAPLPSVTYPDVFGPQTTGIHSPAQPAGVLAPACGVVGATMAVEATKLLTGTGQPALGKLLTYDAKTSTWQTVPLARNPRSPHPKDELNL